MEKENNLVTGTHSIELNRIQLKKINREIKASMEHFKTCQHCFCSVWPIICHLVFAVNCVALDGGSFQWEENLNLCVNDSSIGNGNFVALC